MTATAADPFVHPAMLYRGTTEFLAGAVPFVRAGLAAAEPVMVAVPTGNLTPLREALGCDGDRVRMYDMSVAGRNPGRILPGVLLAFAEEHPGRRVRIIGEPVWPDRSPEEYPACVQHEALINAAFAGRAATIMCPYNAHALDPAWLRDAARTHPELRTPGVGWDSPDFADPVQVAADFNQPLPGPPPDAATTVVELANLSSVRRFVAARAVAAGLAPHRVDDLVIAVNELAGNSVEHGGGTGWLSVWTRDGHLVCQLRDRGHLTDPLAGRIPPPADVPVRGRGLLLVNQLCDLVRMHTVPSGTTIRVHIRL